MNTGPINESIIALREELAEAESVCVMTGAGISAESGIPTFRGAEGLWGKFNPTELATREAFARDPALVWEFYNWRRKLVAQARPNPGHQALARLETRTRHLTLLTQNVDGLHRQAGSASVFELHGNIWETLCTGCSQISEQLEPDLGPDPRCQNCGALLRPNVVWFGESLNQAVLDQALAAVSGCEIMLVIGTSSVVQPAASLAGAAKRGGAVVAEINLERTPNSMFMDYVILGKAGEILPQLVP